MTNAGQEAAYGREAVGREAVGRETSSQSRRTTDVGQEAALAGRQRINRLQQEAVNTDQEKVEIEVASRAGRKVAYGWKSVTCRA